MMTCRSIIAILVLAWAGSAAAVCGDADGNGRVTVADGVNVLRAAAALSSVCTVTVCDVDGNGTITITDGVNVLRAAAMLPSVCGICGNGVLEGDEECDGAIIDNSSCFEDVCTCEDFCNDAGGTLSCNRDCTVNFSRCTAGGCEFF